jgi:hypothetical protein
MPQHQKSQSLKHFAGLGGTSLINANVFLEADEDALQLEQWPEEIRKNKGCLKDCE